MVDGLVSDVALTVVPVKSMQLSIFPLILHTHSIAIQVKDASPMVLAIFGLAFVMVTV